MKWEEIHLQENSNNRSAEILEKPLTLEVRMEMLKISYLHCTSPFTGLRPGSKDL